MPKKVRKSTGQRVREYAVATFLSVVMVWLIYLNVNIARKEEVARHAAKDTQRQLASLQARANSLQTNMTELSTKRGQEATMRQTFGVARPGEGVIIVVPPKIATTTPPKTFWQKWMGWVPFWHGG